jgi:hypothetical protein
MGSTVGPVPAAIWEMSLVTEATPGAVLLSAGEGEIVIQARIPGVLPSSRLSDVPR